MAWGHIARRTPLAAALVCALPWLTACVPYRPSPLSAVHSAQVLEQRSLQDPRLLQFIAAAEHADAGAGRAQAPVRPVMARQVQAPARDAVQNATAAPTWDLSRL